MKRPSENWLADMNNDLTGLDVQRRLRWAAQTYGDGLVMVTSFGPSGLVILDEALRADLPLEVMTLDTEYLFPETYALIEQVRRCYPALRLTVVRPGLTPQQQARDYGDTLWKTDPDLCCFLRKVAPLADALAQKTAWIAGLRRDQSATRAATPLIQWDERHEMVKLAPLADWPESRVWDYIHARNLPYNALHDRNYRSIGCSHCTRPSRPGEESRAGRWENTGKVECGLHVASLDVTRKKRSESR